MARAQVTHSDDSCMIHIKGNPKRPEPTTVVVKFPGGELELSRCSDGKSYWAHLHVNESAEIVDSRVDYNHEIYMKRHDAGIKPIPKIDDHEEVKKMAVCLIGPYEATECL